MHALRRSIPKPLRSLPWRLGWLKGSDAFRRRPLSVVSKLAYWTLAELAGRDITIRLRRGQSLRTTTRNFTSLSVYLTGERDPEFEAFIETVLNPGDLFIDVGANVGVYTLLASRMVEAEGAVLSIEANPSTFAYLEANCALNGLRNVSCVNCAVGSAPGELMLEMDPDNLGETHVAPGEPIGRSVAVPVRTLDEIVGAMAPRGVRYIKIDVEGYELPVLQGARAVLTQNEGVMVQLEMIASHAERYGSNLADVVGFMTGLGFEPCEIGEGGAARPIDVADVGRQPDVLWRRGSVAAVQA